MLVIVGRLSRTVADMGPDDALALLRSAVAGVVPVGPLVHEGTLPRFGDALSYDATRFRDVSGIAVVGRTARVGIMTRDLALPHGDGDGDGPEAEGAESRLDVVLRRLSRLLEGPCGEVVGAVSNDRMPDFLQSGGNPVVRCRDGLLREGVVTDPGPRQVLVDDMGDRVEGPVPLPAVIPADTLASLPGTSLCVAIDAQALVRRYAAIETASDALSPVPG